MWSLHKEYAHFHLNSSMSSSCAEVAIWRPELQRLRCQDDIVWSNPLWVLLVNCGNIIQCGVFFVRPWLPENPPHAIDDLPGHHTQPFPIRSGSPRAAWFSQTSLSSEALPLWSPPHAAAVQSRSSSWQCPLCKHKSTSCRLCVRMSGARRLVLSVSSQAKGCSCFP